MSQLCCPPVTQECTEGPEAEKGKGNTPVQTALSYCSCNMSGWLMQHDCLTQIHFYVHLLLGQETGLEEHALSCRMPVFTWLYRRQSTSLVSIMVPICPCHPEDEDSVFTFTLLWLQDYYILTSPVPWTQKCGPSDPLKSLFSSSIKYPGTKTAAVVCSCFSLSTNCT